MQIDTLVVTDLDGTLWHGRELVHADTLDALAQLDAAGVPVLVATGRRLGSARKGFVANDIDVPAVLLNGALGHDFTNGQRFHEHAFGDEAIAAMFDIFESHELSPCIYTDDGLVHAATPTTSPNHLEAVGTDMVTIDHMRAVPDDRRVLNFSMLGMPSDRLESAAAAIVAAGLGTSACYSDSLYSEWSLMVSPMGISKWQGVEAWCRYAGVEPDRVIALGDGGNDIELLAGADLAIGVRGGDPTALAEADVIIEPPDVGGWATVLDHV